MLKKIKRLFIIEEEKTEATETKQSDSADEVAKEPAKPIQAESKAGKPGKLNPKFMDVLFKAMEQNNIDGFDYLEFKQSLASLKKMPMDEPTRYQSAFAMARTMGATPEILIQTAQHYLDVLRKEEGKFEEALQHQKTDKIGKKQEQIQQLEKTIQGKTEKIKKLTSEIETHRKKAAELSAGISEDTLKVESTKNDFIASYNNLVTQIQNDLDSMKKYLK